MIAGTKSIAGTKLTAKAISVSKVNDKKMLAKAIKDITDPQLKKILSHCIIQYYSASIKLGLIAVPTEVAEAVMKGTN